MRHVICDLNFHTPARFGADAGGGSLTGAGMTFRADMLFSALFRALQPQGEADALLRAVQGGALCFSDALPRNGSTRFIPRPVGIFAQPGDAATEDPSRRKLLKKIGFIPVEKLDDFLAGRADLKALHDMNRFGSAFEQTRVNTRDGEQPLPYRVGGFRFAPDCGLFIAAGGTDGALALFARGMAALAAEGIGGKVSSGWGKFTPEIIPAPAEWARALDDASAPQQLLLSTALPAEDELEGALEDAYTTVVRRGGFAFSEQIRPFKKQTVFLLGAGSTFRRRFAGCVLDVGIDMPHPVWRCARAMFMGVNV